MRLVGTIGIHLSGSLVEREPTVWEQIRQKLGGSVDLSTEKVKVELEVTALVDQVRRALSRLGVHNALSLVVDDTVIFQDREGQANDLPDLVISLSEHASVFGRGFKELRFAAEHDEAGLHLVIETRARTEHLAIEPAAIVSVGGRLRALEPQPGESAEIYRQRVEPFTKDTVALEAARMQFESFMNRLEDALRTAMPEARVEQVRSEARLVKPTRRTPAARVPREPTHPGYDPHALYYPNPMGMMLDAMIISSVMHMMMPSPFIHVVNPAGAALGTAQQVAAEPDRLEHDPGESQAGSGEAGQTGENGYGPDDDGGGDHDDGGGIDSGDAGGFDGGDFGGAD
jgi:hypothetical protein